MIEISLSGWTVLIFLMAIGGWYGWKNGMRQFLTVTLVSAIAYMMFVNGVEQVLLYVDNFYSNVPKLIAIFVGNNPDTVIAWQPIGLTLGLSLPVRFVLFVALVVLARIFNDKPGWYKPGPAKDNLTKQLGAFSGALTVLVWISAITTFWRESGTGETLAPGVGSILSIFPDVTTVAPWLIIIFLLIVVISVVLNLPKLWKA